MATEMVIEIHKSIGQLIALSTKKLKKLLIHHYKETARYNTALFKRGALLTG